MSTFICERLNPIDIIREEILEELRKVEFNLSSIEKVIALCTSEKDSPLAKSFLQARADLIVARAKIENAILEKIAGQIEGLQLELKASISSLNKELKKPENETALLDAIQKVTGIAARILLQV
ncbi:MAG: hypothetical protein KME55_38490 [Nostoc indistinguendum CM1-VF10]|jgi:DNA-binding transcriptional MerR regulator|nr:hypothetical protein [Nostoc indistinguendum CM1-VF10]